MNRNEKTAMLRRVWEAFKAETKAKLGGHDGGLSDFCGTWPLVCEDGVKRYLTIYAGRVV